MVGRHITTTGTRKGERSFFVFIPLWYKKFLKGEFLGGRTKTLGRIFQRE